MFIFCVTISLICKSHVALAGDSSGTENSENDGSSGAEEAESLDEDHEAQPIGKTNARSGAVVGRGGGRGGRGGGREMTRHRFFEIMTHLHFRDATTIGPEEDKASKMKKVLELFSAACKAGWIPGRDCALDEMMVKCMSRFAGIKVRMPLNR